VAFALLDIVEQQAESNKIVAALDTASRIADASLRNTSPLMVWMPCCFSELYGRRFGGPPFLFAEGSGFPMAVVCGALNRLRHSTQPQEMTPTILGIETMMTSLV
jgi:hypothetical protein